MAKHDSNILLIMHIAINITMRYAIQEVIIMAYSESGNKAVQRYIAKAYDQVSVRVPKGQRAKIQSFAEQQGKSLNGYIVELIQQDMEKAGHPLE